LYGATDSRFTLQPKVAPMTKKRADSNATMRKKQTKVEDLPEREMTPDSASEVKGGAITANTISAGLIVPCVRTFKGDGFGTG
jgi:hypothetical protein